MQRIKYTICINQKNLSVLCPDLDIIDAAILNYIKGFYMTSSKSLKWHTDEKTKKTYVWIDYKYLYKNMPLLKIHSTSPIQKRMKKLERYKLIEKIIIKKYMPHIRLTTKEDVLLGDTTIQESCYNCHQDCEVCESFDEFYNEAKPTDEYNDDEVKLTKVKFKMDDS